MLLEGIVLLRAEGKLRKRGANMGQNAIKRKELME
jgi:hypothetical protein